MNLSSCLLVGAGLLLTFGSPQEAQKRAAPDASTQKAGAPTAGTTAPQVTANDTEYKIGAQDLLRIDVWKEDQLTRTVPVRPDGKVTLPLLNDVQAAGLTPMQLGSDQRGPEEIREQPTSNGNDHRDQQSADLCHG